MFGILLFSIIIMVYKFYKISNEKVEIYFYDFMLLGDLNVNVIGGSVKLIVYKFVLIFKMFYNLIEKYVNIRIDFLVL